MKELRFSGRKGSEIWRAAFAFDPERKAIILAAGDKQGMSSTRFCKSLISKADKRFDSPLKGLKGPGKGQ